MTLIETAPEIRPTQSRSKQQPELRVERTDILFHDLPGDRVRIEITVRNEGTDRSLPTSMTLESAPLGAFVPWRPLARLLVPAMDPGESRIVSTQVARPRPVPLGDFNRVPPKRLLTAINSPGAPSRQPVGTVVAMLSLLVEGQASHPSLQGLAPDLLELAGRGQPHWAGNLNVFVNRTPVERHCAKALRVYAGRTNMALFMVGSPARADAYAFEMVGLSPEWKTALYDVTHNASLLNNPKDAPLEEARWVETNGNMMVLLATRPPDGCEKGNLEVHVTRRSCGKTAIVEFDLDPDAQGTGCYFV